MTPESALERLARAEASVAHLERQYDELNTVVIAQAKLLARIQKRLEQLGESIETQELDRIRATHAKPPHYSA
jgi:uncharacterized coiled-coil protein SlyX